MKGFIVGHLCVIIYLVFPSVFLIAVVIKFMNETSVASFCPSLPPLPEPNFSRASP